MLEVQVHLKCNLAMSTRTAPLYLPLLALID